jgi:quinoprotein relay system zinc metallohydrolase 2
LGFVLLACAFGRASSEALEVARVAPGVYVHTGQIAVASPQNAGDIANLSFVVGQRCVAIIDTGNTYAMGVALRAAVKTVTATPVCYVINTHDHPDHVFGNAAFRTAGVQFVGHKNLAPALAARKENYERALERNLGPVAKGSVIVMPTVLVEHTLRLDLGGRALDLKAWRTAHTDTDLTVEDEASGTVWLGDLLFVRHVPVIDGSIRGWMAVCEALRSLRFTHLVPGHGPVDPEWPQALDDQVRYLGNIATEVKAAIQAQQTLSETVEKSNLSEQHSWALFDEFNRRNVTAAYAELEWEEGT